MWDFKFDQEVRGRLHRYFRSVYIVNGCTNHDLWWSNEHNKFLPYDQMGTKGGSNHSPPVRTFKAFKRFLRKHPELNGCEVVLVNRYLDHNITATFHPT